MKIKLFILRMIRKIGFRNLCPHCFTFKTKLISITSEKDYITYRRQCQKCFLSYDIVS